MLKNPRRNGLRKEAPSAKRAHSTSIASTWMLFELGVSARAGPAALSGATLSTTKAARLSGTPA